MGSSRETKHEGQREGERTRESRDETERRKRALAHATETNKEASKKMQISSQHACVCAVCFCRHENTHDVNLCACLYCLPLAQNIFPHFTLKYHLDRKSYSRWKFISDVVRVSTPFAVFLTPSAYVSLPPPEFCLPSAACRRVFFLHLTFRSIA